MDLVIWILWRSVQQHGMFLVCEMKKSAEESLYCTDACIYMLEVTFFNQIVKRHTTENTNYIF